MAGEHTFTVTRDNDPRYPRNWQDFTWHCTCGEKDGWHNSRAAATSSAEQHMTDVHGQSEPQ